MTTVGTAMTGTAVSGPGGAFQTYSAQVYHYLARRIGYDQADDVLGEVFTVVTRRWSHFDPEQGPLLPWLYGIAHRELASYRRAAARLTALAAALAARCEPHGDTDWRDVDDRLDAVRLREPLALALLDLPEDERDVLLLVAWERLSPTEAADVLGIPAGTARSRLHRARKTLLPIMENLR